MDKVTFYNEMKNLEEIITDSVDSDLLRVKGSGIQYIAPLEHFVLHHPEMEWIWVRMYQEICELFDDEDGGFDTGLAIETFIKYGNFAILKLSPKEKT